MAAPPLAWRFSSPACGKITVSADAPCRRLFLAPSPAERISPVEGADVDDHEGYRKKNQSECHDCKAAHLNAHVEEHGSKKRKKHEQQETVIDP